MPSRHKHPSIGLRLPEADRAWVFKRRDDTGQSVNSIIAEAVAEKREREEEQETAQSNG